MFGLNVGEILWLVMFDDLEFRFYLEFGNSGFA